METITDLSTRLRSGRMVPVACADCGYDADGRLHAVDRYASDFPPGPRGTGCWNEVYAAAEGDPDDRKSWCPVCDAPLEDADSNLVLREVGKCAS